MSGVIVTLPPACGRHEVIPAAGVSLKVNDPAEVEGAAMATLAAVTPATATAPVAAATASTRRENLETKRTRYIWVLLVRKAGQSAGVGLVPALTTLERS